MKIIDWLKRSSSQIHSNGISGAKESFHPIYRKLLQQALKLSPDGTPIYDMEWDLLIILDACRFDLMKKVSPEYNFLSNIEKTRSVKSMTREWMRENFKPKYADFMSETIYVCGNPFSKEVLDEKDFYILDEPWKYCWNDDLGTLPPRPVTDRAIRLGRSESHNRQIVHYMQPHHPFIGSPELDDGLHIGDFNSAPSDDIWDRLRRNEVKEQDVWDAYRINLELVLNDVSLLLNNFNANNVVITSDHGNGFGEWEIYGHPIRTPVPEVQTVPWAKTTATDKGSYDAKIASKSTIDSNIEDRLRQLGYHS